MESKRTYTCIECERSVLISSAKKVPVCCGKEMKPDDQCTSAPHSEMARNTDEDDSCDDSRG